VSSPSSERINYYLQEHSKTFLQENPPFLNLGCQLTQVSQCVVAVKPLLYTIRSLGCFSDFFTCKILERHF